MKPEFKVYVKDPSKVSSTEKTITKQVISLIKNRFEESSSMSIQKGKSMLEYSSIGQKSPLTSKTYVIISFTILFL